MNRLNKLRKNEKGQSLVEFAIVAPILIMLVLGIIEFGWLFNGKITLTSAAREGARVVAVTKDQTKATSAVQETSNLSGLTISKVNYSYITGGTSGVNRAKVSVEANMTPLIGLFVTGPVNMKSDAIMRQE